MIETFVGRQGTMIGKKVLLIDDDIDFLALTVRTFEQNGAKTITALDALEGIGKLLTHNPDLVILGILLAGMDGFQVCQRIRQFSNTPLIMLSALDQDQHMLQGLEAGADDVLSKSVNPEILSARAQAVIRRNRGTDGGRTGHDYDDGRLLINLESHSVRIENHGVNLTQTEFRLLVFLLNNADRVLSFEQILFNVWGSKYSGKVDYVHVYISHLRSKIEQDPKNPRYILSVYSVGYIFEKQNDAAAFSVARLTKQ
jgi:DNA-binding response OmpR family regulator